MPLVPLTTLRLYINPQPASSTESNDLLLDLEASAVGTLSGMTGWDLEGAGVSTDYYHGTGTNTLVLRGIPDTGQAFVVSTLVYGSYSVLASTAYSVIVESGGARARLVNLAGGWPAGELNIKVECTRGFTATTCPGLLKRAILDLVSLWYRTRVTAQPTLLADGEAGSKTEGWPASVQAWLEASQASQEAVFLPLLQRL